MLTESRGEGAKDGVLETPMIDGLGNIAEGERQETLGLGQVCGDAGGNQLPANPLFTQETAPEKQPLSIRPEPAVDGGRLNA